MNRSQRYFTIFCSLLVGGQFTFSRIPPHLEADFKSSLEAADTESIFSRGEKINFAQATLFELCLIKGISDTLGGRIIEARNEICELGSGLNESETYKAFMNVKGVGTKLAKTLARTFDLNEC